MDTGEANGYAAQGLGCLRGYVANLEVLAHASDAAQCQEHSRPDKVVGGSLVVVQPAVAVGNDDPPPFLSRFHHWDAREGVWVYRLPDGGE